MTHNDVLAGIFKGKKFSCIGSCSFDGRSKVKCYEHSYGIPKGTADEIKNLISEYDKELHIYYTEKNGEYVPRPTTTEAQITYLANRKKSDIKKIMPSLWKSEEENWKNSCTLDV